MHTQISKCITRLLIASMVVSLAVVPVARAQTETATPEPTPTSSFLDYSENEITMYEPNSNTDDACGDSGSASGGAGGDKLDGYALPASKGKTGNEEAINTSGQVGSTGGRVTFSGLLGKVPAAKRKAYQDYYITMRWTYAAWNWNGTAKIIDSKQTGWLSEKPRLVHVFNPRTKKAIIAVVLEAGPAPWTGVDRQSNNTPKQGWTNPQKGTPSGYTGRVSGFPPVAIKALGAAQGMSDGSGDVLEYSWASDQNTTPGPVSGSGGSDSSESDTSTTDSTDTSGCADGGDSGGSTVNANGYAMPIGLKKSVLTSWCPWPNPEKPPFCHHNESNPKKGSPAFDLTHIKTKNNAQDNMVVGVSEFAIYDGTIENVHIYAGQAGCYSFHLKGKDGWDYYYTHSSNPIKQGREVKAGDKVATVGRRACTGNGSSPHLHIDRGSPKGRGGGEECCRDSGFVPLMNKLYADMPK